MNIIDKRASNPAAALNGTELVYVAQLGADAVTTVSDMQTFITNGFLLITTAASTYQTLSGMSSYLTTAAAASTYQTQSGMSSYATTSSLTSGLLTNLTPTINTRTGTSYTVGTVAADNDGKTYLRMTNASANTVTIPTTQTKPISIRQAGAGITTIQAGANVTLFGDAAFTAQHQTKTVIPLGQVGGTGNYRFDIVG